MNQNEIHFSKENILTVQKTVLLIDDDEDEHEIFSSALKIMNKDFNFISAESCEKALNLLGTIEPNYIFIDLNMPKTNGIVCLEEIKKISRVAHVPIYIYSTGVNFNDGQKALKLGATDYISKPKNLTLLTVILDQILS